MPSHQDRIHRNYPICFHRGFHDWYTVANTDIAPTINEDGTRTTIKACYGCGEKQSYTRSQEQFEKELELLNIHKRIYG